MMPLCVPRRARRLLILAAALATAGCVSAPGSLPTEPAALPRPPLTVTAVGDIMLGGSAASEIEQNGYDYPFAAVGGLLRAGALVFGNLEGPLTDRGRPEPDKRFVFRSPPDKVAPALARAGFNVVSLANNHSLDYGPEGLFQTMQALGAVGIAHAGAGHDVSEARRPALMQIDGRRVAVLAYSLTFPDTYWAQRDRPGTAFGHAEYVRHDINAARAVADIVIVSFHWGQEVTTELRDYQPLLAHAAIDAGAALVLGHHPHVLQAVEQYNGGVIFYSLGNFVFGSYSRRATRSVIAQCEFDGDRVSVVRMHPINVDNTDIVFRPVPLIGRDADAVVAHVQELSARRGTLVENDRGVAVLRVSR